MQLNRTVIVAALGMLAISSPKLASAQAVNPGDGQPTCLLAPNLFTNITPLKCIGFYGGNTNNDDAGAAILNGSEYYEALETFGFDMTKNYSILQKVSPWAGGNVNYTMYGLTVIGFHWGNYPNDFDNGTDVGNVSAYYLFDAGPGGVNTIGLNDTQGMSNVVVLATGTTVTPEPSTYALMAAGLAGVGFVARRRRNKA
jgi:hypothetical protein